MITSAKQVPPVTAIRFWLLLLAFASLAYGVLADQAVYKCGQEITNQPLDPKACQLLSISQPTQIVGTRVQAASNQNLVVSSSSDSDAVSTRALKTALVQTGVALEAQDRKAQARTILEDEWQKLSIQYAELVHLYNRGQPTPVAGETAHLSNYQQRVQTLKAQIQRVERDMQALQREIGRYGLRTPPVASK